MKKETVKLKTPITYYGGKQRIAKWVLSHIPEHRIYCEPFFGGGAVFFAKKPSYLEVINDINDNLINFYLQIQNNFEKLAMGIRSSLHSESMYKKAVAIYNGTESADDIEKAIATWIVFSQSWNASARAGWKFEQGFGGSHIAIVLEHARRNFCPWLQERLKNVQISCRDAIQVIEERDTPDTFFYLDPPYPGTNQGHYSGYTFDDLQKLLLVLQNIKGKFALSNYPSELISEFSVRNNWLLKTLKMKKDSTMASNSKATKTEVLLMNYQISVPHQAEIFE